MEGYILFTEYLDELREEGINIHRATVKEHASKYIIKPFGRKLYIREDVIDDYIDFYTNHHWLDYKLLKKLSPKKAEQVLSEYINLKETSEIVGYHPATIRYQFITNNRSVSRVYGKLYVKKKDVEKAYGAELR